MNQVFYVCDKKKPCSNTPTCNDHQCRYTTDPKHSLPGTVPYVWDARNKKMVPLQQYTMEANLCLP